MILTVGNTKGGVGKSTLALNIAIARALAGRDVWLIDGDRQGTSQIAITNRNNQGIEPSIACAHYPEGDALRQQVKKSGDKYEDVIIDVGGRDSTAFRAALSICDVLVMPFAPRSFEIWALDDMAKLLDEVKAIRGDFPIYAVLNTADSQGHENQEAIDALTDYPVFTYLDAPIKRRKVLSTANGNGRSVFEAKPKDKKACEEVQRLIDMVFI